MHAEDDADEADVPVGPALSRGVPVEGQKWNHADRLGMAPEVYEALLAAWPYCRYVYLAQPLCSIHTGVLQAVLQQTSSMCLLQTPRVLARVGCLEESVSTNHKKQLKRMHLLAHCVENLRYRLVQDQLRLLQRSSLDAKPAVRGAEGSPVDGVGGCPFDGETAVAGSANPAENLTPEQGDPTSASVPLISLNMPLDHDPTPDPVQPDSDTEGNSSDLTKSVISVRNKYAMERYHVSVIRVTDDPEVGLGLYAADTLKKDDFIPAKGPYFQNFKDATTFAQSLPEARLMEKILIIPFTRGDPDTHELGAHESFKIITGVVGFANHWEGRAPGPNAELVFQSGHGFDEYAVGLRMIKQVRKNQEVLYSYGPRFPISLSEEGAKRIAQFQTRRKKGIRKGVGTPGQTKRRRGPRGDDDAAAGI